MSEATTRATRVRALTRAYRNIERVIAEKDFQALEQVRLDLIEKFKDFEASHDRYMTTLTEQTEVNENEDYYDDVLFEYTECLSKINEIQDANKLNDSNNVQPSSVPGAPDHVTTNVTSTRSNKLRGKSRLGSSNHGSTFRDRCSTVRLDRRGVNDRYVHGFREPAPINLNSEQSSNGHKIGIAENIITEIVLQETLLEDFKELKSQAEDCLLNDQNLEGFSKISRKVGEYYDYYPIIDSLIQNEKTKTLQTAENGRTDQSNHNSRTAGPLEPRNNNVRHNYNVGRRTSRENNICGICEENVSAQQIVTSSCCNCILCEDCFKGNFEVRISEEDASKFSCPICQKPEIGSYADDSRLYLNKLREQILRLLPNCLTLFDDKMIFWESVKSGGFAYCSHCGHNFSKDAGKKRCPSCEQYSCLTCKEKWTKEHDGKSCEEYQEWKFQNSVTDITSYFKDIVIECPRCNSSFQSLGGCLHYACTQCSYEFCGSCGEIFFRRDKGLDCYHHRNCFGNLRDITIQDLETLLDINKVEIANIEIGQKKRTCWVESCENNVSKLNICSQHYKEYLIQLINKNDLEVIDLWDPDRLAREFNKRKLVHRRNRTNNLNKYSCMKAEFIRQVPLKKIRLKRLYES